jgi:hypothetical protein
MPYRSHWMNDHDVHSKPRRYTIATFSLSLIFTPPLCSPQTVIVGSRSAPMTRSGPRQKPSFPGLYSVGQTKTGWDPLSIPSAMKDWVYFLLFYFIHHYYWFQVIFDVFSLAIDVNLRVYIGEWVGSALYLLYCSELLSHIRLGRN